MCSWYDSSDRDLRVNSGRTFQGIWIFLFLFSYIQLKISTETYSEWNAEPTGVSVFTTIRPISLGTWGHKRKQKAGKRKLGCSLMPEFPHADKTFLVFASLWRTPFILENASRPLYDMNVADAVLHVYLCTSIEEMLSVHVTHKHCVRIQGVFKNGLMEN